MASLAAYPGMMRRDREGLGLRECRAAWLLGLTVREYRALEAGDASITPDLWDRMVDVFGWPVSYWPPR
jgi:plasmid maintenance system antidote protein VapI